MRLEIRDAEDQTVYDIGPEGAVLGRERAKTDISLRDESISKRHARIFHDDGAWFLEDLGSSNGTYVDDQRISGPVLISQGMAFSLAQRRFDIVHMDGGAPVEDFPPPGMMPPPQEETGGDMPPLPGMESQVYVPTENNGAADDGFSAADGDEAENTGIKYFFVAVPKAVAYYLVNVPLMGLNPIGVIRRGVEDQKLPAMSKMEVAAYAIPAGLFGALVGGVFGAIAALVNGAFGAAIGALVASLPAAAIAGAIGGVFGFFAHPILEFIIRILKGESNPRSRSNFFIASYTFAVLAAVPNGIATVVSALPIPFISLLGPLLSVLVSLVGLFLYYLWIKHFRVHKVVQYVVLVLGILSVVGTGVGFVTGLISQISNLGSGGGGDTPGLVAAAGEDGELTEEQRAALEAAQGDAEAAMEAARKAAEAAAESGGEVDERTKAALEAARKKSAEAARLAAEQAAKAAEAGEKAAEAGAKAAEAGAKAAAEAAAMEAKADPMPPPTKRAPPPPPPARTAPAKRRVASGPVKTEEHPLGRTPFVVYLEKRDAVERAIDDDPSLVRRRDIRRDYEQLWVKTYEIREKYRKRYRKKERWERDKIGTRLKGQEIMEKTAGEVDRLYDAIFGG